MIQMLRKEACSGAIQDLAHVRTEHCLSDSLTKHSANPDSLIRTVETGILVQVDTRPPFRDLLQHKAFETEIMKTQLDSDHMKDYYEVKDSFLIRYHQVPRRKLYNPSALSVLQDLPVPLQHLLPCRTTYIHHATGEEEIKEDSWLGTTTTLPSLWTGRTVIAIRSRQSSTSPTSTSPPVPAHHANCVHMVLFASWRGQEKIASANAAAILCEQSGERERMPPLSKQELEDRLQAVGVKTPMSAGRRMAGTMLGHPNPLCK